MSEPGTKRARTDGKDVDDAPDQIDSAQQFYVHAVNGGWGPVFLKPGDKRYLLPDQVPAMALLSRGLVIEESEVAFGNVAPPHATSVVRVTNKITGINVGDTSVPAKRFAVLSAIQTAKRKGASLLLHCKDSYLAIQPFQLEKDHIHIGTTTITLPDNGDGLGELFTAMSGCLELFATDLPAAQLKAVCEKAISVINLAKTNMRFWTAELKAVLAASDKKELLAAVTAQRAAAKASDAVLQFCALLITVTNADLSPEEFMEVLTGMENAKMAMSALTMFGKFPLPSVPKAKDKGMLFVDERGTPLEIKKLVDANADDVILVNDGAIVAEGQVLNLLSAATTVYVKPATASVFFKGKSKGSKYEERKWKSVNAKPIKNLIQFFVAGGLKDPSDGKGKETGELLPADEADDI